MEITDGPAVTDHVSTETPFVSQCLFQQGFTAAGRFTVDTVVGAHHGLDFRFPDSGFKRGQVGFIHIFGIHAGIKLVPDGFRPGMNSEMLAARRGFQVFSAALQSFDEADAEPGGQIGILSVGFMSPSPARVTKNVDVRAPDGQAFIDIPVSVAALSVVFCPRLIRNNVSDFLLKVLIKHGSQADGLRKNRGGTGTGNTVKHFIPPVIGRNSKPRDRGCVIFQLRGFLLKRHAAYQLFGFGCCFGSVSHGINLLHLSIIYLIIFQQSIC